MVGLFVLSIFCEEFSFFRWVFSCFVRWSFLPNAFSHIRHLWGRIPEWMRECLVSSSFPANARVQPGEEHANGLSPVWVRRWPRSWPLLLQHTAHCGQVYFLRLAWFSLGYEALLHTGTVSASKRFSFGVFPLVRLSSIVVDCFSIEICSIFSESFCVVDMTSIAWCTTRPGNRSRFV